jgi:hypothetical protein
LVYASTAVVPKLNNKTIPVHLLCKADFRKERTQPLLWILTITNWLKLRFCQNCYLTSSQEAYILQLNTIFYWKSEKFISEYFAVQQTGLKDNETILNVNIATRICSNFENGLQMCVEAYCNRNVLKTMTLIDEIWDPLMLIRHKTVHADHVGSYVGFLCDVLISVFVSFSWIRANPNPTR